MEHPISRQHIRSPGTIANLKKNPMVEINVVDPFARKGYRFKGTGKVIAGGEIFREIMNFYRNRWVDTAQEQGGSRNPRIRPHKSRNSVAAHFPCV
jgi:hypothetical protein